MVPFKLADIDGVNHDNLLSFLEEKLISTFRFLINYLAAAKVQKIKMKITDNFKKDDF